MHNYINFLLKKSDINKNEFHSYNPKRQKKSKNFEYKKIFEPTACNYVIFDFETTGLSPENDKIIEIGALKVIEDKVISSFNELIDPERPIPPYISEKINITNEMVFGKRKIEKVLPEFIEFIEDLPLIAHNAKFDMSFLLQNIEKMNLKCNNPAIDTLYLSRKYLNLEKNSLSYITNHFGINHDNAHRAFADVSALLEVYKIIKKTYAEKNKNS